jgi:hypothetical protein
LYSELVTQYDAHGFSPFEVFARPLLQPLRLMLRRELVAKNDAHVSNNYSDVSKYDAHGFPLS